MNFNKISLNLILGATIGILYSFLTPSFAQTAQDLQNYPTNEKDPYSSGLGGDINPMELMHQLQLSNGRSMSEFLSESNRNIDNEASNFKEEQQKLILQQTPKNDPNSIETDNSN